MPPKKKILFLILGLYTLLQTAMNNKQERKIVNYLLQDQPITPTVAVRIILEGIEALGEHLEAPHAIQTLRRCMQHGVRQLLAEKRSLPFAEAVQRTLMHKQDRSPRTIQDFRQCMNRLMKEDTLLAETPLSQLDSEACSQALEHAWPYAPVRRKKARACLSSLFRMGIRHGWCRHNPVDRIDIPRICEKQIAPLKFHEIQRLLSTARLPQHASCLPALGLMLFAGVRPKEVTRLTWDDIDMDEREIIVPPRHSKTGGGRHIPICSSLLALLHASQPQPGEQPICPPNWLNRWRALRLAAGFTHWQQDILRHTYASYHTKAYHNLPALQLYMGHRDASLLLTRYVNLKGLTRREARQFWESL